MGLKKMIKFINTNDTEPFRKFIRMYKKALLHKQEHIEALNVSSYSLKENEVDSRYVNLKILDNDNFIFFSNYQSAKAEQFELHNKISCSIFWSSIYLQIRMKGKIKKTSRKLNLDYFSNRSIKKNALAISSMQSRPIESFELVTKNYNEAMIKEDLYTCPEYWGGYAFTPYYFEFWEGDESRLNKRDKYEMNKGHWEHSVLQP